jgi:EAL domain-containing protein (putative c-di-GMP-specific phosphodiesterase class I)/GGDEF domain-containing protein
MTSSNKPENTGENANTTSATSEKLRQSTRLKTSESARLSFSVTQPLECEIRDFSTTGLQLAGLDQTLSQSAQSFPTSAKTRVEIEFPLNDQGIGQYKLQGDLVRSSQAGLGLKLDNMTDAAYQALVNARANIGQPDTQGTELLPEEHQAMVRDCMRLFHLFLDRAWKDFLDGISFKLAERDTGTLHLAEHSRYLGSMAYLLKHGEEIGRGLSASVVKRMQRMAEPRQELELLPSDTPQLSIVDDNSFDDWLSIAHVFQPIEADNREAMYLFGQCFSRLAPVPIDHHNDPFGPEAVCMAFQETILNLDFSNRMRGLIYKAFGEAIAPRYPAMYEQLNQLLAPLKPARPERPKSLPGALTAHQGKKTEARPDDIAEQIAKLTEIAEKLFALTPGSRTTNDGATSPSVVDSPSLADPAVLQVLAQTLSKIAGQQTTQPVNEQPLPAAPPLDELLNGVPAGLTLTHQVAALLGQPDAAGLSSRQRDSLSLAASLMGQAMTEHGEQSDLDGLLKKLEKPLYELVLQGEDPLNQTDHPLRRLLNLVDRFAIVTDDRGKFTDRDLGDLLTSIIDQAAATSDNFGKACDALEKLLKYPSQYHRQRVTSYQEGCETQETLRTAKLTVAQLLDQRLSDRAVPRMALTLLDLGLRQHLVLQSLRGNGPECLTTLHLLDALLDRDRLPPAAIAQDFESRLLGVNTNRKRIETGLTDLTSFLAQPKTAEIVSLPTNWFVNETGLLRVMNENDTALDMPNQLGEWWDVDLDGFVVPMQLIWISLATDSFGFVNRSATRKLQLNRAELAKRLTEGTLRRGEDRDLPLLERSENGSVDSLYRRLAHRAHHDTLTGLLNLKGFLFNATRQPHVSAKGHVVGMLEFAPFRAILDNCGIEAGQRLTQELAAVAQHRIGASGTLATVGDGLLAFLLPDLDLTGARRIAYGISYSLRGFQFQHGQANYQIEARIGLTGLTSGSIDAAEAIRRATAACTAAIHDSEAVQVYEDSSAHLREQESLHAWGQRIDNLLGGDTLFLRCQRIVPLAENATMSPYYEILLGVRDESGKVVSPQPFVEAVEFWKRSHDLDIWVIEQTFAWIRANPALFIRAGGFSINLSSQSMSNDAVLATLNRHLAQGDLPADRIGFEITETTTVGNYDAARDFIRQIRRYGCRFSIDDFGSGNASYGYLRNLRTEALKIDGAYVKDMVDDPDLQAMVKSMNDIGHSLGMKTVAEYVATPEILALVREIGVDYAQGYEVAMPVHIDELARL